jgi:MFS family permease
VLAAAAPFVVILAGVCAALHVGKLPPAIAALQQSLGIDLVSAGFLVSLVQLAGMIGGVGLGALADGLGLKRSMVLGLGVLAAASAIGGSVDSVGWLLALRAVEGLGFLLVVLPAPGLVRRLVAPDRLSSMLGVWGTYMPFGAALALLVGPFWIETLGWRSWWWALGATAVAMAICLHRAVPGERNPFSGAPAPLSAVARGTGSQWTGRLRQTLGTRGPWLVAMSFAAYSSQWLAVIGFLPTIYLQAGIAGVTTGVLTSLAAAANIVGNLAAARLMHHGTRPTTLLAAGFIAMALCATAAFAGAGGAGLPASLRYAAVLLFSMLGGIIPATLFALAVRLAPNDETLSSTVGWVQQWSALGQFAGPPLVAWMASRAGGWHWTWTVTAGLSLLGLGLSAVIERALRSGGR